MSRLSNVNEVEADMQHLVQGL